MNPLEQAAERAMSSAAAELRAHDLPLTHAFVILHSAGDIHPNAIAGGRGYEDDVDLLSELLGHCRRMAEEMGLRLDVIGTTAKLGGQG